MTNHTLERYKLLDTLIYRAEDDVDDIPAEDAGVARRINEVITARLWPKAPAARPTTPLEAQLYGDYIRLAEASVQDMMATATTSQVCAAFDAELACLVYEGREAAREMLLIQRDGLIADVRAVTLALGESIDCREAIEAQGVLHGLVNVLDASVLVELRVAVEEHIEAASVTLGALGHDPDERLPERLVELRRKVVRDRRFASGGDRTDDEW